MKKTNKIILLSKKIASAILKEEKIDNTLVNDHFDEKDTKEIIQKLTDVELKKQRETLSKTIQKSKREDWETLKSKIQPKQKILSIQRIGKIAAILLISLSIGYYYIYENTGFFAKKEYAIKSTDITLKLDNGTIEIISANGEREIIDKSGRIIGNQKGKVLNYNSGHNLENITEELVYNELTVPYGKTFQLVLSDGTSVHLNSGSSLKFPVKFLKNENRHVFINGEAYFKVSKDKEHPFIVSTNNLNVRVLGTEFNITSYPEDNFINTVLVEGSVSLYQEDTEYSSKYSTVLTPGKKATWNKSQKSISVNNVNTSIYTGWIDGKIIFEHMPFKNIIKKLERHYNVSITNHNHTLDNETFTAAFDIETIDQVLKTFSKSFKMNYSIENNNILIY